MRIIKKAYLIIQMIGGERMMDTGLEWLKNQQM
jgi:hypothetical protein